MASKKLSFKIYILCSNDSAMTHKENYFSVCNNIKRHVTLYINILQRTRMTPHVILELRRTRVRLPARSTHVRPLDLLEMHRSVVLQHVAALSKRVPAHRTRKDFLTRVRVDMLAQRCLANEHLGADLAGVRPGV